MIKRYLTSFATILIAVGLCLLLFGGCSSKKTFVEAGYDTIATTNTMVDSLMTRVGDKYQEGKISEDQKQNITEIYSEVRRSSNLLDETLADYASNKTSANRQKYLTVLESFNSNKVEFLKLVREVLNE